MASGRKFRTLNLMDGYTREAVAIEVDTSLPGARVVRGLEGWRERRGLPQQIVVDHGTKFTSRVVDPGAYQRGVELHFITPDKPTENAFIERVATVSAPLTGGSPLTIKEPAVGRTPTGATRLNEHWFMSLAEAREKIEVWRRDYHQVRPHSALA